MPMRYLWLSLFFITLVWSGVGPKDYLTWVLEVLPAVIGLVILVATRRFPLNPFDLHFNPFSLHHPDGGGPLHLCRGPSL